LFTLRVCVKDFSQNLYNTHPARVIIFFCNFPHLSIAILGWGCNALEAYRQEERQPKSARRLTTFVFNNIPAFDG
jgi:hypothetical protein